MPTVPASTSNLVTSVNGMIGDVVISGGGGGGGGNNDPGYGLIAGGGIVYQGNLDFLVAAAQYVIAGTIYNSPQTSITLDAADPSNPRIDIFVFTTSNTVVAIKGTAAAAPAAPSYDPGTQLYTGALVTIPANASSITAATNTLVYDEDTGTPAEWNVTSSGSGWTLNSATNPLTGTVDIFGNAVAAAAYVKFAPAAAIDLANYQNGILSLPIRVVSAWANKRGLQIQFYSGTATVGSPITILNGAFNFNSSLTSAYQYVVIPLSQFGIAAGTTIDSFRVVVVGGAISFRLDNIRIQGAAVSGGGNGLTQQQADARYLQLVNYQHVHGDSFDGAGAALAATTGKPFFIPLAGTVKEVILTATDANGAAVSSTATVDLWIRAGAIPTVANTVVASDKPALSNASYVNKPAGATWTTAVAANSVGIFHIDSNDNAVNLVASVVIGP